MNPEASYNKIKNLFLRQSCQDAWEDWRKSLYSSGAIRWGWVILTASNERQAEAYRIQLSDRMEKGLLPEAVRFAVLPDPGGKRVGSGGATLNVLRYIASQSAGEPFAGKRILVIHSGGDSKRVPQYSAVGKLFSPVPRTLPDGRGSTLFDEFMIGLSGVPARIREGMLVVSGDVLLLFNPLQIDAQFDGAAAISFKEPAETGKDHGVFLNDGKGNVQKFLHKQSVENLQKLGAVNRQGMVDLDTGAVLLTVQLLNALYSLISTGGKPDGDKFHEFVNERARISFYGDFLYPLASDSDLESFYREKPEGDFTPELRACREKIWQVLQPFSLKLLCLSPARFIHFGTTKELLELMREHLADYEFLDWNNGVASAAAEHSDSTVYSSYIGSEVVLESGSYAEYCSLAGKTRIGTGSVVSGLELRDEQIPGHVVLHALPLADGFTVRVYGVQDNPKSELSANGTFLSKPLGELTKTIPVSVLWEKPPYDLWTAKLYPVCETPEQALRWALDLADWVRSPRQEDHFPERFALCRRTSLAESYQNADLQAVLHQRQVLENRILCKEFTDCLARGESWQTAAAVFGKSGITDRQIALLEQEADKADFALQIRIPYALSRMLKQTGKTGNGKPYDAYENSCFSALRHAIAGSVQAGAVLTRPLHIAKERVDIALPVRVNWGGGWTDTPPYCNEKGGVVLNAAIRLNGQLPIRICVKRASTLRVEFESQDIGVTGSACTLEEIRDCHNPYDSFALHKAALIACGVIPRDGGDSLEDILREIGGGIYLSTSVIGVPKGSGLGTSSILSAALAKGIFEFFGQAKTDEEICDIVLAMEQIMSTGGGWQDQIGGLFGGVKLIASEPGLRQKLSVTKISLPENAKQELADRFALIYTGQRRLARNLLREVVGKYIGGDPETVQALGAIKELAVSMADALRAGDIDTFAVLLRQHWDWSKKIDAGTTNRCIDHIFLVCEDLIDSQFIAGAGGGGFVMVILKKGVTREQLRRRLLEVYQDSGVDVWQVDFVD